MTYILLNALVKNIGIDGREHDLVPHISGYLTFNSRTKDVAHLGPRPGSSVPYPKPSGL